MKKLVFVAVISSCILFAAAGLVFGQNGAYASNVPEEPFSWVLYTYEGETDLDESGEEAGKVALGEVDLLTTPFYLLSGEWEFSVGLGWRWTRFEFNDTDQRDLDVYTITAPLDLMYTKDAWSFWGNVTPGVFSDLEHLTRDDYCTLAYALGMYQSRPDFQWALGASYNREFGRDIFYPLGGFIWKIGSTWEINMLLPMPRVTCAPNSKLLLFADARPAGGIWNIEDEETEEQYDLQVEGYRLGLGLEYELAKHIWIHVSGGGAIEREYEIQRHDHELLEARAEDTWFVRAGLVIR